MTKFTKINFICLLFEKEKFLGTKNCTSERFKLFFQITIFSISNKITQMKLMYRKKSLNLSKI